ncbi:MAG TPA: hypothetical protein VFL30_10625 [Rhodanobacteraceae bacterium]|nr:hypothetical protein [Rhodanobacteraceae bacterium]
MRVTIGFRCHSGWAAAVAVGRDASRFHRIARLRVELVEPADSPWAKAPYHAAEDLGPEAAHALVQRAKQSARTASERALRELRESLRKEGHDVAACAVLTAAPMPDWSTEDIRAVHVRMHKAEGAMFPAALIAAAKACDLASVTIVAKTLDERAAHVFGNANAANAVIATLGWGAGPPWGADQKSAALAAAVALASA